MKSRTEIYFGFTCRYCGRKNYVSLAMGKGINWELFCHACRRPTMITMYKVDVTKMDFEGRYTKDQMLNELAKGPIHG